MSEVQRSEYQQIAAYARLEEAELVRGLLESDGIPVALLDAQVAGLGLGPATGVRLLIPGWAVPRAAELLSPAAAFSEDPAATPTPLPGSLPALTPAPMPRAELTPAAPQPGPLPLRIAVWVAVALALASAFALS